MLCGRSSGRGGARRDWGASAAFFPANQEGFLATDETRTGHGPDRRPAGRRGRRPVRVRTPALPFLEPGRAAGSLTTAVLRTGFWSLCLFRVQSVAANPFDCGRCARPPENGHRPEATEGTELTEHAGIGENDGVREDAHPPTLGNRPIADYRSQIANRLARRVLEDAELTRRWRRL